MRSPSPHVDPGLPWRKASAIILLAGVTLNLVGAGLSAFLVFGVNLCYIPSWVCGVSSGTLVRLWDLTTILGVMPLVALAGPRPARVGIVSQAALLFVCLWTVLGLGGVLFLLPMLGGLLALVGSAGLFHRGRPGPPVTTVSLGVTWTVMAALWMVLLLYSGNYGGLYQITGPGCYTGGCGPSFAQALGAPSWPYSRWAWEPAWR